MLRKVMAFSIAAMLIFVVGCSKAPQQEMQNADAAITLAVDNEAAQYAPAAYKVAMDTLNAAKAAVKEQDSKFVLFRSYGKSKEMCIAAERLAKDAVTTAQAEKEKVKAEVSFLMTQVESALEGANAALAKAPRGKGSRADIELMQADLDNAKNGIVEAKADFDGGKYLAVKAKLETIQEKINEVNNQIEAAKAKKK